MDPKQIYACIDRRRPPAGLATAVSNRASKGFAPSKKRMAVLTEALWTPGQEITYGFIDHGAWEGDDAARNLVEGRIRDIAQEWMEYANVVLVFTNGPDANIRISFKDRGSWSAIGRQCLEFDADGATMNYGWLTPTTPEKEYRRVVLHEFGHALGCIHEHQNPAGGIKWNKEAVYKYYQGPPNNWNKAAVDHNLFELYSKDITQFTDFDAGSIMLYPVPKAFTTDGFEVGMNTELSQTDKTFASQLYPR